MKVSEGCRSCYAESMMDKRYGRVQWGQMKTETTEPSVGTRVLTSVENRRKPYSWQRRAADFMAQHGRRQRVFCSSLSDVFDNQVPEVWRSGLWTTIHDTPDLDWLLLTKRPENILKFIPAIWRSGLPRNIWLGVTAEDQAAYDRRLRILADVPAAVHFISYEPAIGPLDITKYFYPSWLICGGESGTGYRDMPLEWARSVQRQCRIAGVPFFMKQLAGKKPIPADLMTREFPVSQNNN